MRKAVPVTLAKQLACGVRATLATALLLGCAPDIEVTSQAPAQADQVTGLPQRAIRSVSVSTVKNFMVLIEIEYFYDRIGKPALIANAPNICARRNMTLDRIITTDDRSVPADTRAVRARQFHLRCR